LIWNDFWPRHASFATGNGAYGSRAGNFIANVLDNAATALIGLFWFVSAQA